MRINSIAKFVSALSLIALSACTKPSANSTIQIQLPDFNKLAAAKASLSGSSKVISQGVSAFSTTTYASRLMINVHGSGMNPIVIIRTAIDNLHAIPSTIPLTVPVGSGRLIQVMVVTKTVQIDASGLQLNDGDDSQEFYYGDLSANVAGDTSVDLWLSPLNATVGAQGAIAGRYLDAASTGATGDVDLLFQPPNGKPQMIVSSTEIHGGWFEFSAFAGLPLSYVMRDGRTFFPGFDLTAYPASTVQSSVVVQVPSGYKPVMSAGSEVARVATVPRKLIFGYFGSPLSGLQMCYDNTANPSISDLYTYSIANDPTMTPFSASMVAGGVGVSGGSCTGTVFDNWLALNEPKLEDFHGNLGFQGPFRTFHSSIDGSSTLIDATPNSGNLVLNWNWLPGVTGSDRVSGVGVFIRASSVPFPGGHGDREFEQDGMMACNRLTDPNFLAIPFQFVSRFPNTVGSSQTATIPNVSWSDFNQGKIQVVVCPYSDSRSDYFRSAVFAQGGNSGTQGLAQASSFAIGLPGQTFTDGVGVTGAPSTLYQNQQYSIQIYAVGYGNHVASGSGTVAPFNGNVTFTNSGTAFNIVGSATVSFVNGVGTLVVQPQLAVAGTSQILSLNYANPGSGFVTGPVVSSRVNLDYDSVPIAAARIYDDGAANVLTSSCQPYLFDFEDSTGVSRFVNQFGSPAAPFFFNFSFMNGPTPVTGAVVGADSTCSTSTQLSVSAGSRAAIIYLKSPTVTGTYLIQNNGSSVGFGNMTATIATSSGSASMISIAGSTTPHVGACTPYMAVTTDSSRHSFAAAATETLTSTVAGTFFSNPSCTGSGTGGSLTIPTSGVAIFYFMPAAASSGTFSGSGTFTVLNYPFTSN